MTLPLVNLISPLVDGGGKVIPGPWSSFFQQFTQAPSGVMSVIVGSSPFLYTAREPGFVAPVGGTISTMALIRGAVSINVTGLKLVPVSIKDSVLITYSVLPVIQFIPSF